MKLTNTQITILGIFLTIAIIIGCAVSGGVFWFLSSNSSMDTAPNQAQTQFTPVPANTSTPTPIPTPTISNDPCSSTKLQEFATVAEAYRLARQDAFDRWVENMGKRPEYYVPIHQEIADIYLEVQRLDTPNCQEAKALRIELL